MYLYDMNFSTFFFVVFCFRKIVLNCENPWLSRIFRDFWNLDLVHLEIIWKSGRHFLKTGFEKALRQIMINQIFSRLNRNFKDLGWFRKMGWLCWDWVFWLHKKNEFNIVIKQEKVLPCSPHKLQSVLLFFPKFSLCFYW